MAQQGTVLGSKPDDLIQGPGVTRWKERANFSKSSSDLPMHATDTQACANGCDKMCVLRNLNGTQKLTMVMLT